MIVVVVPSHGPSQNDPEPWVISTGAPPPAPVPESAGRLIFAGSVPPVVSEPPGDTKPLVSFAGDTITSVFAVAWGLVPGVAYAVLVIGPAVPGLVTMICAL